MIPETVQELPFVSIVVIVFNMENTIAKCLSSLVNLGYPSNSYEIIVIDGGSNDSTQGIIKNYPQVKIIIEAGRNRSLARNLGIKNSKGSIIAFTDADCEVKSDWLTVHVSAHLAFPDVAAVCGSVIHDEVDKKNLIIRTAHDGEFDPSSSKRYIYYLTTSNASFKRTSLIKAGTFDEKLHVGEDAILSSKILSNGSKILFEPSAKIIHHHYKNFRATSESNYLEIIKNGQYQLEQQIVRPKLKFRLPMRSSLVLFLFPSLILLRALRFFHKMRFMQNKLIILRESPFIFFYSFWWIYGYFLATFESK